MRKSLLLLALVLVAGGTVYYFADRTPELTEKQRLMYGEEEEREGMDKQSMLKELYKQWDEMMRDPATGRVPVERLVKALEYTRNLQALQKQGKVNAGISGVVWVNRGPTNVGGRTRTILISPNDPTGNTGIAGSVSGGLWISKNLKAATPTWAPVNDFFESLSISSIVYDPTNTNIFYAGTGEGFFNADAASGLGILKSTDGGTTWDFLPSTVNSNFYFVNKMAVKANGDVFAATSSGMYRSKDKGATWEKVLNGTIGDVEVSASGVIFASGMQGTNGVYKSETGDLGTFTNLCTAGIGLPSTGIQRIETAVAPSDANTVYSLFYMDTTAAGGGKAVFYRSTDNGASFVRVSRPADADPGIAPYDFTRQQGWYDLILKVDPNDSKVLYTGGIDAFKSVNGGDSWTQLTHWYGGFGYQYMHADQHGIEFEGNKSDIVYFTSDGGVAQTLNGTASMPAIAHQNSNYITAQFYATAGHPDASSNYYLAGAQDNGTKQFTLPGTAAANTASGGDGAYCNIDQSDPKYQFTQYVFNNYYRSQDGGASFNGIEVSQTISNSGRFINPSDYDENTKTLYAAGNNGSMVRWSSATTGTTFKNIIVSGMSGQQVSAVTASVATTDKLYLGTGGGSIFYVTNPSTATISASTKNLGKPVNGGYVNCIWEDPTNANHLVIAYSNYGVISVWETLNATNTTPTWTAKEGNLPDIPVYWVLPSPLNSKEVMVGTEVGVYSTANFDAASPEWVPSVDGMANVRVTQIRLRPSDNVVYASTHGRGLFTTDVFAVASAGFSVASQIGYTGKAISFTDNSVKASAWQWDFNGDGVFDSQTQNPSYTYTASGVYNVKLRINNDPGLEKVTQVTILPDKATPYVLADGGDFETNAANFAAENIGTSKFSRGSSTQPGKNGTNSGSNAWVIDPDKAQYSSNSTAYLYTPSYNFTATGAYTISFYAKYEVENEWDGFRVEYTTDKGTTWMPLGTTVQADWYDYDNATADRPFPKGEAYFTKSDLPAFQMKKYTTSALQGNPSVAFRFVFKADPFEVGAGLALDDFTVTGPSNPVLPVNLVSFTGTNSGSINVLRWNSATEINSNRYEVERSVDGRNFQKTGSVRSANAATGAAYSYNDNISHLFVKTFYYRLKMVDNDGKYSYSNVVSIYVRDRNEQITILGNRTSSFINILVPQQLLQKPVQANIINANGAVVRTFNITNNSTTVYVDKLAAGTYFVRFVQDKQLLHTGKFVKQ